MTYEENARINELIQILDKTYESDPDRETKAKEFIALAEKDDNYTLLAYGYFHLALHYNAVQTKFPLFAPTIETALEYAKKGDVLDIAAMANLLLGMYAVNFGQYNLTMNYLLFAKHYADECDKPQVLTLVYYYMCAFFGMLNDPEKAIECGEKALEEIRKVNGYTLVFGADAYDFSIAMLGECYVAMRDIEKVSELYRLSLERQKKYIPRYDCHNTAVIYSFHIKALYLMGKLEERDRLCEKFLDTFKKHSPSPPFFFPVLNLINSLIEAKAYHYARRFLYHFEEANKRIKNPNFGVMIADSKITLALLDNDDKTYHEALKEFHKYSLDCTELKLSNVQLSAKLSIEKDEIKMKMQEQQNEIRLAKASSEAKSTFLSNVSHEIRTPLNAILGMDEMILRESRDKDIYKYASDIKSAGNTLLGLINDILDSAKLDAGKLDIIPVEYDVSSVITDLINMIKFRAEKKGLDFNIKVASDIPYLLFGDEIRIKQCVLNILTNAVKYTEKGSVTLEISSRNATEAELIKSSESVFKKADGSDFYFGEKCINCMPVALKFRVIDTGIGIKEEDLKKLYKPFERIEEERNRSIEGTGLGMNIVQRLLNLMNSHLEVKSVYGEGSDFSFEVVQGRMTEEVIGDYSSRYMENLKHTEKYEAGFIAPDANILVVDDTPANLTVVKGLLKETLINIDTAGSGKKALDMVREKNYDILFIDQRMPEMDGIETLKAIKNMPDNKSKNAVYIALTANAISGAREMFISAGFDDYLTKPVDYKKLERLIANYLRNELLHEPIVLNKNSEQKSDSWLDLLDSISAIDKAKALESCAGNADILLSTIEDFVRSVKKDPDKIVDFMNKEDFKNYTILVHGLKSSARLVGAIKLSNDAQYLEKCGDEADLSEIKAKTPALIEDYRAIAKALSEIIKKDETEDKAHNANLPPIAPEALEEIYGGILEFVSAYDFTSAENILKMTENYSLPDEDREKIDKLYDYIKDVDHDSIIKLL